MLGGSNGTGVVATRHQKVHGTVLDSTSACVENTQGTKIRATGGAWELNNQDEDLNTRGFVVVAQVGC